MGTFLPFLLLPPLTQNLCPTQSLGILSQMLVPGRWKLIKNYKGAWETFYYSMCEVSSMEGQGKQEACMQTHGDLKKAL